MSGANRYSLSGDFVARFIPSSLSISDPAAITVAEVTDGSVVDLVGPANGEGIVADSIQGFQASPSTIPVPDYVGDEVGTIPGQTTYPDSSFEIYAHKSQSTIRSALTDGADGYIMFCHGTNDPTATTEYDLFPVTVLTTVKMKAKNEAHKEMVSFSVGVPTAGVIAA